MEEEILREQESLTGEEILTEEEISDSPFYGTPWNSEEDIYDYINELYTTKNESWESILQMLISEGLDPVYASQLIYHCEKQETREGLKKVIGWTKILIGIPVLVFIFYNFTLNEIFNQNEKFSQLVLILILFGALFLIIDGFLQIINKRDSKEKTKEEK